MIRISEKGRKIRKGERTKTINLFERVVRMKWRCDKIIRGMTNKKSHSKKIEKLYESNGIRKRKTITEGIRKIHDWITVR